MSLNTLRMNQNYLSPLLLYGQMPQVTPASTTTKNSVSPGLYLYGGRDNDDSSLCDEVSLLSCPSYSASVCSSNNSMGMKTGKKKKKLMSLKDFLDQNNAALNNLVDDEEEEDDEYYDDQDSVQVCEVEDIDDRSVLSFLRNLPPQCSTSQNKVVLLSSNVVVDDETVTTSATNNNSQINLNQSLSLVNENNKNMENTTQFEENIQQNHTSLYEDDSSLLGGDVVVANLPVDLKGWMNWWTTRRPTQRESTKQTSITLFQTCFR